MLALTWPGSNSARLAVCQNTASLGRKDSLSGVKTKTQNDNMFALKTPSFGAFVKQKPQTDGLSSCESNGTPQVQSRVRQGWYFHSIKWRPIL